MDHYVGSLRIRVEQVDAELLSLLRERAELARQIGRRKGEIGMPVHDPEREDALLRRAPEEIRDAYRAVIRHCREIAEREAAGATNRPRDGSQA
jgi:chorismate mutase